MFTYSKDNYALEATLPVLDERNNTIEMNICRLQIYGQGKSNENRYLLGNAFLRSYYIMLDYQNDIIGINGEYRSITYIGPPKP